MAPSLSLLISVPFSTCCLISSTCSTFLSTFPTAYPSRSTYHHSTSISDSPSSKSLPPSWITSHYIRWRMPGPQNLPSQKYISIHFHLDTRTIPVSIRESRSVVLPVFSPFWCSTCISKCAVGTYQNVRNLMNCIRSVSWGYQSWKTGLDDGFPFHQTFSSCTLSRV